VLIFFVGVADRTKECSAAYHRFSDHLSDIELEVWRDRIFNEAARLDTELAKVSIGSRLDTATKSMYRLVSVPFLSSSD
jgi:hypothetical protein